MSILDSKNMFCGYLFFQAFKNSYFLKPCQINFCQYASGIPEVFYKKMSLEILHNSQETPVPESLSK